MNGNPLTYTDSTGLMLQVDSPGAQLENAIATGNLQALKDLAAAYEDVNHKIAQTARQALADYTEANANRPADYVVRQVCSNSEKMAEGSRIRKVEELVYRFEGKARDWVKKKGWNVQDRSGTGMRTMIEKLAGRLVADQIRFKS